MPRYPHLLTDAYDTSLIGSKMRALRTLGVPYTDGEIETAVAAMARQAKAIAAEVEAQKGPTGLADKEIIGADGVPAAARHGHQVEEAGRRSAAFAPASAGFGDSGRSSGRRGPGGQAARR